MDPAEVDSLIEDLSQVFGAPGEEPAPTVEEDSSMELVPEDASPPAEASRSAPRPKVRPKSPAPPPTIKVSVKRDSSGLLEVFGLDRLPNLEQVAEFIPRQFKAKVKRTARYGYYSLTEAMNQHPEVGNQAWADAIAEAAVAQMAGAEDATVELKSMGQGAYLAMGDVVYKLSPVAVAPQTKALAVARRMVLDRARAEAEVVKLKAKADAKEIIVQARQRKAEADRALAEAQRVAQSIPPSWMQENSLTIKYLNHSAMWAVRTRLQIQVEGFDLSWVDYGDGGLVIQKTQSWGALPTDKLLEYFVWVPVQSSGEYAISSIRTDGESMPHIGPSACCAELSGAPEKIQGPRDLQKLRAALEFTMRRVQLDSLRSDLSNWIDKWSPTIPGDLLLALRSNGIQGAHDLARSLAGQVDVPTQVWEVAP